MGLQLQQPGFPSICQDPEITCSLRLGSLSQSCNAEQPFTFLLTASVQGAPKEVVDPSSGRATLLESIRQAGGIGKAKLRSVKERKLEKKKQKEQEQGEGGTEDVAVARLLVNPPKVPVATLIAILVPLGGAMGPQEAFLS